MREILFRGKRISNGEWVYGGIVASPHPNYNHPMVYAICSNMMDIFVDQDSIGQYTGMTDKNGTKIFEGDVVQANFRNNNSKQIFIVVFDDGMFLFDNNFVKVPKYDIYSMKVIGNIHDNPELLEGGDS